MAVASIIIALAAVLSVIYRDIIRDWFRKPELEIESKLEEPVSRETMVEWPPGPSVDPRHRQYKKAFWPRLRITNKGRSMARRCEAILAEVRNRDGSLNKRYDPLTLRWAVAPIERGLQPLDIARNRTVDLNIFTTFENETDARFATHAAAIGVPLFLEPGDYWLCIVIYGDNFKPVKRGYAVHWDGADYRKGVRMQEMNNKPSSTTTWPW
ncbi:MAG: hypothetical protein IMY87_04550 [Chloroflexi bacterium]|nr:hypothetical protein [Chloroflexota bacterium]